MRGAIWRKRSAWSAARAGTCAAAMRSGRSCRMRGHLAPTAARAATPPSTATGCARTELCASLGQYLGCEGSASAQPSCASCCEGSHTAVDCLLVCGGTFCKSWAGFRVWSFKGFQEQRACNQARSARAGACMHETRKPMHLSAILILRVNLTHDVAESVQRWCVCAPRASSCVVSERDCARRT